MMKELMNELMNEQTKRIKIACVLGSPHKDGMTARLLRSALKGAEDAGAETMLIHLVDEEMKVCRACSGKCWDELRCVLDPASGKLFARFQDADGLIMAVPVYCWQVNGLMHEFMDRMRWNTGSVLKNLNRRAAFGIACAGGSGTGCVMALQSLYRYFYNWSFHGITPLPVTRYNFESALQEAYEGGKVMVETIRAGVEPFSSLGAAIADMESLPFMSMGAIDELNLIVGQLKSGIPESSESTDACDASDSSRQLMERLYAESMLAEEAFLKGDRKLAAVHLSEAYFAGREAWTILKK